MSEPLAVSVSVSSGLFLYDDVVLALGACPAWDVAVGFVFLEEVLLVCVL